MGNHKKHRIKSLCGNTVSWANQIRMLKQNFQKLGSVIGSGFIAWLRPMVVAVNNAMDSIISAVQKVVNALGKIFGWEMIVDTTGDSLVDDTEEVAEAWDDATGAAKKYAKQLLGIDEINNLTTNDSGSGSGDEGAGGGISGGNIVKPGGIEFKKFESEIDNLYDLGKKLSDAFANLLPDDWSEIYEKAANFGTGLADFLNGLIQPDTFKKLGKTIAGSIMTAITALASFSDEADWEQYGESLGEGINGFFEEFDGAKFAEGLNKFAEGVLKAIRKALETVEWDKVWEDIVGFISNLSPATIALALGTITIKKVAGWVFGGGALSALGSVIKKGIQDSLTEGATSAAASGVAKGAAAGAAKKGFGSALKNFMFADIGTTVAGGATWATIGATIITGIVAGATTAVAGWHFGQWLYEKLTGDDTDYGNFVEQMASIGETIVDGSWLGAVEEWMKTEYPEAYAGFKSLEKSVEGVGDSAKNSKPNLVTFCTTLLGAHDDAKAATDALELFGGTSGEATATAIKNWDKVEESYGDKGVWNWLGEQFSTVVWGGYGTNIYNGLNTKWEDYVKDTEDSDIWGFFAHEFSSDEWQQFGSNVYNGLHGEWNLFTSDLKLDDIWGFISDKFSEDSWTFSAISEGLSKSFGAAWEAVKQGWNTFADWLEARLTITFDKTSPIGSGLSVLFGGASEAKLIKLPRFENGGFPNQGSLFVAGETYGQSEWLGNINGKTGVASGYEITGIANAIYDTSAREMELLRQQNEYLIGILNKEFGISRDAVGEASRSYARDYYKRTGNQAYSF